VKILSAISATVFFVMTLYSQTAFCSDQKTEKKTHQVEQRIDFCLSSYNGGYLDKDFCERHCREYYNYCPTNDLLSKGWKIIATTPKIIPVRPFQSVSGNPNPLHPGYTGTSGPVTTRGCECIGTEYVMEK
jgi:hypothetical protein